MFYVEGPKEKGTKKSLSKISKRRYKEGFCVVVPKEKYDSIKSR